MKSRLADSALIRRFIDNAKSDADDSPKRQIARETDALPAYLDMGGALVLTVKGEILEYDPESGKTTATEEPWKSRARVRLAREYEELADLMPRKPPDAVDCDDCLATGVAFEDVDCSECSGLGWRKRDDVT